MLELRPSCENCNKALPNESSDAMICTFECTFCSNCVQDILENVCPNCGGGFEKRPTRPSSQIKKYPASKKEISKPLNWDAFKTLFEKFKNIPPRKR